MLRVELSHPGLADERPPLRPTHARLVFDEMEKGTGFGSELGFAVRAAAFSAAATAVRDRYRCRDVRKELGRAIRFADRIEDDMGQTPWLRIACEDHELLADLLAGQSLDRAA